MKLYYAVDAIDDLRRLREYVAQKIPAAAGRISREIVTQLERLTEMPRFGRPVPQVPDPETVRDLVFGNYVVRYSVHADVVVILRVWHRRENRKD